ncbi:hypothetical protein, partial [Rhizobium pisi]|uniref:hypothetical protein n=1 Tax=Rhizobium pisi TaxID=574561 RepID=UPI003CFE45C3
VSLERKTSSPAAPPPSFSEWAYRTNTRKQSTALFEKSDISFKSLFLHRKFWAAPERCLFPDSERPDRTRKAIISRLFVERVLLSSSAPRHHHNLLVLREARFTQANAGRLPFPE